MQYHPEPLKLTSQEIEQPYLVIEEFFTYADLNSSRELLREVLRCMVVGDFHELDVEQRSEVMVFYEQLERLTEAAHIIYQQEKDE